jgi:endonuclease/exonuclease/phosphatase family metal-dependent hydrolase
MRTVLKSLSFVLALMLVLVLGFLGVATVLEYRPGDTETLTLVSGTTDLTPSVGDEITLISLNIGYAGLGHNQDFFMDGGDQVRPDNQQDVEQNLTGIEEFLENNRADVYFLQEVDSDAHRSYRIDEVDRLGAALPGSEAYAMNFNSLYTPYPVPPIGAVQSGLVTSSAFGAAGASRVALPVPFKWPVRLFNLKRCLLVERVPVAGGQDLVLVNLHLEAYEDGEGRQAQMDLLWDFLQQEYAKGNYVIAGGDFNQSLPGVDYPKVSDNWEPGVFDTSDVPEGWTVANDPSTPTSRLNDARWNGSNQVFGIDGFVTSPNVGVEEVLTLDEEFEYTDHNPVWLRATLLE